MRLIDANALIAEMHNIILEDGEDRRTFYEVIERQPTIESKKGKWTVEDCHAATYKYCCSNCTAHHRARYDYCPSCGADMKEGEA